MTLEVLAVVNQSTLITDPHDVHFMAQAVSRQIHQHAAPAWDRMPVHVIAIDPQPDGSMPSIPDDAIPIFILDNSDQADALGYHDVTPDGHQYGRVFVKPVLDNGGTLMDGALSVSAVLSHEALEWFVDPACSYWAGPDGTGFLYALEVGDPVESDFYNVAVGSRSVAVSNFVLPGWFNPEAPNGTQLDLLGNVLTPFTMSRGGYVIKMSGTEPNAVFGEEYPEWRKATKGHESARTARRARQFMERNTLRPQQDNALQIAPPPPA